MRKCFKPLLLIFSGFLIFSACAGIVRLQQTPREVQENTLEELMERWEGYYIYATVWRGGQVKAIIFDPKADDKRILADRWVLVQSKEELSGLMARMKSGQTPRLFRILGPQENMFGHIYTPNRDVQVQLIDEQTIRVYEIKPPNAPAA
jgi:hypothetical protein